MTPLVNLIFITSGKVPIPSKMSLFSFIKLSSSLEHFTFTLFILLIKFNVIQVFKPNIGTQFILSNMINFTLVLIPLVLHYNVTVPTGFSLYPPYDSILTLVFFISSLFLSFLYIFNGNMLVSAPESN